MEDYERLLLVKQQVFVFKLPPRPSNRGYKAADWNLENPDWTGRMRIVSKGEKCFIKLEDKTTGELFATAPIDNYPGIALEPVTDSSRYFVLRIEDDNGRTAYIGIGFRDRGDSFDMNVTLGDYFKQIQATEDMKKGGDDAQSRPNLDLSFKEGQTITLNLGKKSGTPRPKPSSSALPQPGGIRLPPPPRPYLTYQPEKKEIFEDDDPKIFQADNAKSKIFKTKAYDNLQNYLESSCLQQTPPNTAVIDPVSSTTTVPAISTAVPATNPAAAETNYPSNWADFSDFQS